MKKPTAFIAFLAALLSCCHSAAQGCPDLSDQKRAEILHYVKTRYSLPDMANIQLIADDPVEGVCFRKLTFATTYPDRKFTMYLTADQRYLASALLDLSVDPEVERQRKAEENRGILTDRSPSLGLTGSPVTIVEFSDFQCPYCRRFAEMFDSLAASEKAKVRLEFRELPLQMHKLARLGVLGTPTLFVNGLRCGE
ncbi:MAG TPA: thioredoxin domain-containing protein [Bryobacteraceae bacterium]|jgi:protein-disulfide isomerase|nr:thioredoxin domain-containing protein [Bryobacteraceae bacterium]